MKHRGSGIAQLLQRLTRLGTILGSNAGHAGLASTTSKQASDGLLGWPSAHLDQ